MRYFDQRIWPITVTGFLLDHALLHTKDLFHARKILVVVEQRTACQLASQAKDVAGPARHEELVPSSTQRTERESLP
jgi:hypothetical protein